jgi:DNA-binding helix-hairpin-helix protein with protein kinase domain
MSLDVWLTTRDGRRSAASLGEPVGSAGSQGRVFGLRERPDTVVKVLHQPDRTHLADRLRVMLADPADWTVASGRPLVAWPTAAVHRRGDDRLLGYAAPRLAHPRFVPLPAVFNPAVRARILPGATWAWWLTVAEELARVVHVVHQRGHVIGDLAPPNVFVSASGGVCLIDADGWQLSDPATGTDLPCPFSRPECTAPEELDGPPRRRAPASDHWALAVLVAQVACLGFHPFGGVPREATGPVEEVDNVRLRRCRLLGADVRAPVAAVPPDALPAVLRHRLGDALDAGYAAPAVRPGPQSWAAALAYARDNLVPCPAAPTHVYPRERRHCPWCRMVAAGAPDPFPGGGR